MPHIEVGVDMIAFLTAFIGVIFWFARLEFVSKQNKIDLDEYKMLQNSQIHEIKSRHDDVWDELKLELKDISKSLARLEGIQSTKES